MNRRTAIAGMLAGAGWAGLAWTVTRGGGGSSILNASYDATRELYRIINERFRARCGTAVRPSHGGSGKQALAVKEGLPADVVSLAVWPDFALLQEAGLLAPGWESRLPGRSLPFTSTIVFVVRRGNPHRLTDWPDLIQRPGLRVVAANPKIGGAAKLAFIAAWGAMKLQAGETAADRFVQSLFTPERIPILEGSSRTATQTFARKNIGDVQLTWESEAVLEQRELGDSVEIIRPSLSVLAEPHVAMVDANVQAKGTRAIAEDYLKTLYDPESQRTMASLGFRPHLQEWNELPAIKLFRVDDVLPGGWREAQERFFDDGGLFDSSYR